MFFHFFSNESFGFFVEKKTVYANGSSAKQSEELKMRWVLEYNIQKQNHTLGVETSCVCKNLHNNIRLSMFKIEDFLYLKLKGVF